MKRQDMNKELAASLGCTTAQARRLVEIHCFRCFGRGAGIMIDEERIVRVDGWKEDGVIYVRFEFLGGTAVTFKTAARLNKYTEDVL